MHHSLVPMRLSLVIPCYNESDRIALMFGGIRSFIQEWKEELEVIIVNDGSKDNTLALLQQHPVTLEFPGIIKILTQDNTGKGGALRNGVLASTGDFVLTIDADMASPPSELFKWQTMAGGSFDAHTIYIGSREHLASVIKKEGDRKVAGNIFNRIVQLLTPLKMKDTQCGFKLYPGPEARRLFNSLQTYGWAHDVELLYKAHLDKMKIQEMPLQWNAVDGSKVRLFQDGFNMMLETFRIAITTKLQYPKKQ